MTYAEEIEQRTIHNSFTSYTYNKGRLTFKNIIAPNPSRRIGGEIIFRELRNIPLFKSYIDGIAFLWAGLLYEFNAPVRDDIKRVIYKYYNRIKTIEIDRDEVEVLQYKLLPTTIKFIVRAENFTDYLSMKYNSKGE